MNKWLIILMIVAVIIIITILLTVLPVDVSYNNNLDYRQIDVQMKRTWY